MTADLDAVTVTEAIALGMRILPRRQGIPDPRREAMWLLAASIGVDETWVRLHPEETLSEAAAERFRDWLHRRASGVPAHHLTGTCPFWGRDFIVSPAVLVPRPETELIVQTALDLPLPDRVRVLDVGTGSGCLAVTLAVERSRWQVTALDRSVAALRIAALNAQRHGVQLGLLAGDLTAAVAGGFHLLLANLPYLPSGELPLLSAEVQHDPSLALDGGADGLVFIRRLLADLPRLLKVCGGAILEVGDDQADRVVALAAASGLAIARRVCDVSGCERVLVLQSP